MKPSVTPEEALAYLNSYSETDIEPGLAVMDAAMQLLAEPQLGYPVIQVAGTNGKSSVARLSAAILSGEGLRCGLYTSPHLDSFFERIEIGGVAISADEFAAQMEYLRPFFDEIAARAGRHPTYFEMGTILAFCVFLEAVVDAAVIECGLGGLFDATNVVDARVGVITNISLDHANFLGSDLDGIAREKAGIIKAGSIVVSGVSGARAETIEQAALAAGAEELWRLGDEIRLERCDYAFGGTLIDVSTPRASYTEIEVPLLGHHQGENAALAIAASDALLADTGEPPDSDRVREAIREVSVPGRLELISTHPLVVVDGAHNPAGAQTLCDALSETLAYERMVAVVGAMADKDIEGILAPLVASADKLIATTAPGPRAAEAEEIARMARSLGADVAAIADPEQAVTAARQEADEDDLVLVAGSLHLVGALRAWLLEG